MREKTIAEWEELLDLETAVCPFCGSPGLEEVDDHIVKCNNCPEHANFYTKTRVAKDQYWEKHRTKTEQSRLGDQ